MVVLKASLNEIPLELVLTLPRSRTDTFDIMYQDENYIYFIPVRDNVIRFVGRSPRLGLFEESFFNSDPFWTIPLIIENHMQTYQQIIDNNAYYKQSPLLKKTAKKKFYEDLILTFFIAEKGEVAFSFDIYKDNIPSETEYPLDTIALELEDYKLQMEFLREAIPLDAVPKLKVDDLEQLEGHLGPIDWLIFSLINEQRTVQDIALESGIGFRETLSILNKLNEAEFIELAR